MAAISVRKGFILVEFIVALSVLVIVLPMIVAVMLGFLGFYRQVLDEAFVSADKWFRHHQLVQDVHISDGIFSANNTLVLTLNTGDMITYFVDKKLLKRRHSSSTLILTKWQDVNVCNFGVNTTELLSVNCDNEEIYIALP